MRRCSGRSTRAGSQPTRGAPSRNRTNALRIFDFDYLLISAHPADRSTWLERRVVERARARFAPPITHVVVDLRAGLADTPGAQGPRLRSDLNRRPAPIAPGNIPRLALWAS